MATDTKNDCLIVTTEDVNRLLEVGRLLLSVLTKEELNQLQQILNGYVISNKISASVPSKLPSEIGNTGVT
jgi:hypothetical protein